MREIKRSKKLFFSICWTKRRCGLWQRSMSYFWLMYLCEHNIFFGESATRLFLYTARCVCYIFFSPLICDGFLSKVVTDGNDVLRIILHSIWNKKVLHAATGISSQEKKNPWKIYTTYQQMKNPSIWMCERPDQQAVHNPWRPLLNLRAQNVWFRTR